MAKFVGDRFYDIDRSRPESKIDRKVIDRFEITEHFIDFAAHSKDWSGILGIPWYFGEGLSLHSDRKSFGLSVFTLKM